MIELNSGYAGNAGSRVDQQGREWKSRLQRMRPSVSTSVAKCL